MSFVKLDKQNSEYITLTLRPNNHFISSSAGGGVSGSQFVSPIRSKCIRDVIDLKESFANLVDDATDGDSSISKFNADSFIRAASLEIAKAATAAGTKDIEGEIETYLNLVSGSSHDVRFTKNLDIFRFDPPFKFTKNTTVKNVVRNVLMPFYEHKYQNCGFHYTNYHTLNFFDNSNKISTGSAILYPNIAGSYDLPDDFAINFWINPRYSSSERPYRAGTVLHLSSSICVSIVSGSTIDKDGAEDTFKILIQLSSSADTPPSMVNLSTPAGAFPNDLIFTSSNLLNKNHWHNVFISWSKNHQNGTGSLFVDDVETKFQAPHNSLSSSLRHSAIVLGNYFNAPFTTLGKLVGDAYSSNEGFIPESSGLGTVTPGANVFSHPLNAEIHDVRIYKKAINKKLRVYKDISTVSPKKLDSLVFYVPPYFFPSSSNRQVLVTPFQTINSSTNDPFNVQYSFGVGGKMINLENFTLDYVNMRQPRLLELRPNTINTTIQNITADEFTYGEIPTAKLAAAGHPINHNLFHGLKRNLTILPNDNGLHSPQYDILMKTNMSGSAMFQKRNRMSDFSIINLENLIPTASLYPGLVFVTGSIFRDICGTAPENPGVAPGSVLTIAQRTRDVSTNEISIIDISNLYYGSKIHPTSVTIFEENLTGSNGDISVTLKDNGRGGLFRADCLTKKAEWNNVGNVLYEDGIIVIKTPHLFFFGKDKLDIKFRGEQSLHSMILNIPCPMNKFMSSSNKTFTKLKPNENPNDKDLSALYISNVNIHDENLNVIMKANLAQPIQKTEEDEFIIRLKQDF
tara:strand:+ start:35 stop:2431 length:2397 start_codon:yes stop_codon:yes gene_type:complete